MGEVKLFSSSVTFGLFVGSVLDLFLRRYSGSASVVFFGQTANRTAAVLFMFPVAYALLLPASAIRSGEGEYHIVSPLYLSRAGEPVLIMGGAHLRFSVASSGSAAWYFSLRESEGSGNFVLLSGGLSNGIRSLGSGLCLKWAFPCLTSCVMLSGPLAV